jgi:hypothetical protein
LFYTQLEAPFKNKAESRAMIQDVKQWIDEIQILQKKLTEAAQERDEAFASAAKWRTLYETEAKQRRTEANLARQNANALKVEIQQLQELPMTSCERSEIPVRDQTSKIQQAVQQMRDEDLKAKLIQALVERDRLAQALKTEQAHHAQTRQALTTILGDTVEHLTQERAAHHKHEQAEVQRQTVAITHETVPSQSKTPLLALPPTNSAQSLS